MHNFERMPLDHIRGEISHLEGVLQSRLHSLGYHLSTPEVKREWSYHVVSDLKAGTRDDLCLSATEEDLEKAKAYIPQPGKLARLFRKRSSAAPLIPLAFVTSAYIYQRVSMTDHFNLLWQSIFEDEEGVVFTQEDFMQEDNGIAYKGTSVTPQLTSLDITLLFSEQEGFTDWAYPDYGADRFCLSFTGSATRLPASLHQTIVSKTNEEAIHHFLGLIPRYQVFLKRRFS